MPTVCISYVLTVFQYLAKTASVAWQSCYRLHPLRLEPLHGPPATPAAEHPPQDGPLVPFCI